MKKMPNRTATAMTEATISAFEGIGKQNCISITPDHGKEFSKHREIATALKCKVYFADAGCPWQRGTNENTNGLIRQFFPKRTSFKDVTQADLDSVNELLNKRPRKCLAWKTPFEVFFNKRLHFI
jgi:IS30 family transposase